MHKITTVTDTCRATPSQQAEFRKVQCLKAPLGRRDIRQKYQDLGGVQTQIVSFGRQKTKTAAVLITRIQMAVT